MNIAFTGHRDYDEERINSTLYRRIEEIVSTEESVTFLCGMAVGFDLSAAEVIIRLREDYSSARLHCVVPFADQSRFFSEQDRLRYERVLEQADEITILESEYSKLVYLRRNDFLVENADLIIAYFNSNKKGGTAYTIRKARRANIEIENLYPQQQLSLF